MKNMKPSILSRGVLGLAITCLLLVPSAHAVDLYWVPGTANWDTTDVNWSTVPAGPASQAWNASPTNSDMAVFQGTGAALAVSSLSAGGIDFTVDGFSLSAGSVQTLTFMGATPTVNVASGATAVLDANVRVMSDTKAFSKTGEGTLELTGSVSGTNYYLGRISSSTLGAKVSVAEGILKVSGNALSNTYTEVAVATGAKLEVNATLNLGGLSGAGTIEGTVPRTVQLRGINTEFSGVISGNLSLTKNNGLDWQRFSGNQSNTFNGDVTIDVGEFKLAKTGGAIALSGSNVNIGGTGSTNPAKLTLEGNEQIADDAQLVFTEGNKRTASFDLGGFSETLGTLVINNLGTGGSYTIDYGANLDAQILWFSGLSTPGAGILDIINFGGNDDFRFTADPTAGLGNLTLNGGTAYTFDQGTYWSLSTVPEPGSLSLFLSGVIVVAFSRMRTRK